MAQPVHAAEPGAADVINLRAGRSTMPADSPGSALRAFVATANQAQRIDGLPDTLNPGILDPDKVVRLAAALPRLPAAILARLAGHDLYLDDQGLQAHAGFPSRPDALDGPVTLEIEEIQGRTVLARIDAMPDAALARGRATDAAARLPALEADIQRLEHATPVQDAAVRTAKERRQAVARFWRMNALAWSKAASADPAATRAAAEADAAARAASLPPGGGTVPR